MARTVDFQLPLLVTDITTPVQVIVALSPVQAANCKLIAPTLPPLADAVPVTTEAEQSTVNPALNSIGVKTGDAKRATVPDVVQEFAGRLLRTSASDAPAVNVTAVPVDAMVGAGRWTKRAPRR